MSNNYLDLSANRTVMPTDMSTEDRNRQRIVVFYGRVSTEHEAQLSALENQIQWYDDQANYHPNWVVKRKYIDEGITGTQAKKRPAFLEMLEDAEQKKFDLIVTREVCRFARNTVDTLVVTRKLKNYGIEVYFVEDNIWTMDGDGELRLTLMATLAQEESRKTSERVRAGQKISRDKGVLYGNGNILGYDRVGDTYVINPEQAETVRMIYDLYLKGYGFMKIVNEMVRLHRKDSSGLVRWECTKISRILHNATYKGYKVYLKSHSNNFLEQKPIINRDESTYLYVKGDFEPIISEAVWDECKRIRDSKTAKRKLRTGEMVNGGVHQPKDLWVRKMICNCGYRFRKDKWHRNKSGLTYGYKCYNQLNNGSKQARIDAGLPADGFCAVGAVADWKIDMMLWMIFKKLEPIKNETIREAYRLFSLSTNRDSTETVRLIGKYKGLIESETKKLDNLTDMRMNGELTKDEYVTYKEKVCGNVSKLERQLTDLQMRLENEEREVLPTLSFEQFAAFIDLSIDFSERIVSSNFVEEAVKEIVVNTELDFSWYLNLFPHEEDCNSEYKELLSFTIDFESARKFRNLRNVLIRKNQWHDVTVHILI